MPFCLSPFAGTTMNPVTISASPPFSSLTLTFLSFKGPIRGAKSTPGRPQMCQRSHPVMAVSVLSEQNTLYTSQKTPWPPGPLPSGVQFTSSQSVFLIHKLSISFQQPVSQDNTLVAFNFPDFEYVYTGELWVASGRTISEYQPNSTSFI